MPFLSSSEKILDLFSSADFIVFSCAIQITQRENNKKSESKVRDKGSFRKTAGTGTVKQFLSEGMLLRVQLKIS